MRGKVVSLKDYGAFIELEQGIEGLVHISEMSWTRRVKHPSKVVAVGDTVEAVVLDIDPRQNRISLGMKQLEPNPFASLKEKYPPGTVVKGVVRNIADFGIFVEIEEGIDGLVHVSDLSWTQRVKHPSELYQKGDEVESVVLNIDFDGEKPKVSLGIKQLVPDPWDRIPYDYPPGKIVDAKVIKVLDFGAFVEIEKGVEGLIHVSEFSEERVEDPKQFVKVGQTLKAEIIGVDTAERKIGSVVPRRRARRGAGRRAGLLGRRAHGDARRRHARQAGGADRQDAPKAAAEEEGSGTRRRRARPPRPPTSDDDDESERRSAARRAAVARPGEAPTGALTTTSGVADARAGCGSSRSSGASRCSASSSSTSSARSRSRSCSRSWWRTSWRRWWSGSAALRDRGRPFPRGLAVIILYINILAVLGLFIGLLHPQAVGRLRPPVPRGAAAVRAR